MMTLSSEPSRALQPSSRSRPADAAPPEPIPAPGPSASALSQQKKWAPRGRTGCLTCRKRRVKCDETKPVCQRCVKGGRECIGSANPAAADSMPQSLNPTTVSPTAAEKALSSYFLNRVLVGVADEFNQDFFGYFLPQAMHSLEPIWHASNAVAAISWSTNPAAKLAPSVTEDLDQQSVRLYSASVNKVHGMLQRPGLSDYDKTTILLASILYSIYAGSRCDKATFQQLRSMNHALIRHWRYWECMESRDLFVSETAAQIFYYFVKGTAVMEESIFQAPESSHDAWLGALQWLQNRPLASIMHAYIEIEILWASIKAILGSLPFQPTAEDVGIASSKRSVLQRHVTVWAARCDDLFSTAASISGFHTALFQAQRILIGIFFQLDLDRFINQWDETCWDDFQSEFTAALNLLASLLVIGEDGTSRIPSGICVPANVFRALTLIARACRAPRVRRRAATLQLALVTAHLPQDAEDLDRLEFPERLSVSKIILLEEIAWREASAGSGCETGSRCVRDGFICNRHRVVKVHLVQYSRLGEELSLQTVGEIMDGQPGHKIYVPEKLPNRALQWARKK